MNKISGILKAIHFMLLLVKKYSYRSKEKERPFVKGGKLGFFYHSHKGNKSGIKRVAIGHAEGYIFLLQTE